MKDKIEQLNLEKKKFTNGLSTISVEKFDEIKEINWEETTVSLDDAADYYLDKFRERVSDSLLREFDKVVNHLLKGINIEDYIRMDFCPLELKGKYDSLLRTKTKFTYRPTEKDIKEKMKNKIKTQVKEENYIEDSEKFSLYDPEYTDKKNEILKSFIDNSRRVDEFMVEKPISIAGQEVEIDEEEISLISDDEIRPIKRKESEIA